MITVRPTIEADLPALTSEPLPYRIKAITGLIGDKIIGIGGIGFRPDGTVVALAELSDEARAHKYTLHRAAKKFLAEVKAMGIRELITFAEPNVPCAENWLRHLGFQPVTRNGETIWRWATQ